MKVFEVNDKQVTSEIKRLSKNLDANRKFESRRAVASVLNKSLAKSKTKIVRRAAKSMQIPAKAIRSRVQIKRATAQDLGAKVWVGLNPISAQSAGAKPNSDGYALGPYQWQGAFTNSKLKGVYHRKGNGRYPLVMAKFGEQFTSRELKQSTDYVLATTINGDFSLDLIKEMLFRLDRAIKRG